MAERFGVDDIKRRTGISDAQLDRRLEEGKFWELADILGNYEEYIGTPGFDLSLNDKAELNVSTKSKSHQHVMVEAFKKWLNVSYYTVTYRSLIKILIRLRKIAVAEKVCKTGELLTKYNKCQCDLFFITKKT